MQEAQLSLLRPLDARFFRLNFSLEDQSVVASSHSFHLSLPFLSLLMGF